MSDLLILLGRVIFGAYFVMNGVGHLKAIKGMTAYATSKGLPQSKFMVIFSGWVLILAGVGVIAPLSSTTFKLSLLAIALFLLITAFVMHAFWKVPAEEKRAEKDSFMRNLALMGGALMALAM